MIWYDKKIKLKIRVLNVSMVLMQIFGEIKEYKPFKFFIKSNFIEFKIFISQFIH
jgi:hypothetical protein